MFKAIRKDSQGQDLDVGHGFGTSLPIGQYAGKFYDFTQPMAVFFLFSLYGQLHSVLSFVKAR